MSDSTVTPWTVVCQTLLSMRFSRQEYWSGYPFLSPGDLPTQGSNPGLLRCRKILYPMSHQGSQVLRNYLGNPKPRCSTLQLLRDCGGNSCMVWVGEGPYHDCSGNCLFSLVSLVPSLLTSDLWFLCFRQH